MGLMRTGLVAVVTALLGACGTSISYLKTNEPPRPMTPKTSPEAVEVLTTAPPTRPYVEVGMLQGRQASEYSADDMGEIVQTMRQRAAEIGCDAIVIVGNDSKTFGSVANGNGSVTTLDGYRGSCIVYTDTGVATAASAAATATAPAGTTPAPSAPRDKAALAKVAETKQLLSRGQAEKAEALATGTVSACADRCSAAVVAQLWSLAGVARVRRNDTEGAVVAFRNALAADPAVTPDDAVTDDSARSVFYATRGAK